MTVIKLSYLPAEHKRKIEKPELGLIEEQENEVESELEHELS